MNRRTEHIKKERLSDEDYAALKALVAKAPVAAYQLIEKPRLSGPHEWKVGDLGRWNERISLPGVYRVTKVTEEGIETEALDGRSWTGQLFSKECYFKKIGSLDPEVLD